MIVLKAEEIIFSYLNKGLSDIGICDASPFEEERCFIEKANESLKGFVEQDIEKRIYPSLTMPEVKSIISVAYPYVKNKPSDDGDLRVNISSGAVGEDYHITLKNILDNMAADLKNNFDARCMVFVDTGPLSDRAVAVRSGTGHKGKNGSLVSGNCGSGVFLGYILTDLELEKSKKTETDCGNCRKCLDLCPTKAITENGFEAEKCISYITQKKGILSEEEMSLMGKEIYGCDICHRFCAKTKIINETMAIDEANPLAEEILSMDNKAFKERFGNTAMSFRGRNIIRRNVLCALSNIRTKESLELINKYINDESEIVSKTALKAKEKLERDLWDTGIQED